MNVIRSCHHIEGVHKDVVIEIDERGKWVRFLNKPIRNYNKTLRECYNLALDANTSLSNTQRTRLKQSDKDPTR